MANETHREILVESLAMDLIRTIYQYSKQFPDALDQQSALFKRAHQAVDEAFWLVTGNVPLGDGL